jgi:RNase H-fold protein (predicted Holliday junction resolvase)
MRILGLDVGIKSLGIAITDDHKSIVSPIDNLKFNTFSTSQYLEAIKNTILKYGKFDTIVIGYPLKLNNLHSQ